MSERLVGTAGFSAHPTGEYPTTNALAVRGLGPTTLAGGPLEGVGAWIEARFAHLVARFLDFGARGGTTAGETADEASAAALTRIGGPVARWISFPRGVRTTTAVTSLGAFALDVWAALAFAHNSFTIGLAVGAAGLALASSSGPLGVRLANRLHRLIAAGRRHKISELRGVEDRQAVAVRGVVIGRRTIMSTMDNRSVVWSLTRFRSRRSPLAKAFFHEVAFDFLIDDGTDEPIVVQAAGGMVIDPFPSDRRVQFQNTTLLDIAHPFLTRLRLRERKVLAAEISIAPGDVVEVVGRLSRHLDPTARSTSGREPPQRRALRSGTRVPVMVRKIVEPDLDLARVRRLSPRGAPDVSPGEPPVRRF